MDGKRTRLSAASTAVTGLTFSQNEIQRRGRYRNSDEAQDLRSSAGRPCRTRTVGCLHRHGPDCLVLRDLTDQHDFLFEILDRRVIVRATETASNATARTQYVTVADNTYADTHFGSGPGLPLLFLQHFT